MLSIITPQEISAILRVTAKVAGVRARISLFGSRTRNDLRGDDIDLLVELSDPTADKLSVSLRTSARLQMLIGSDDSFLG